MTQSAWLFPGQGAQSVGMGREFVERFALAREMFDEAREVLGYDLGSICLDGPEETLTLTRHCQPAIFLVSSAIVRVFESTGRPKQGDIGAAAGLSLGEYTALAWAGAMSFADGLRLVARRGELMQAASDQPPSGMVSLLGADRRQADAIATEAAQGEVLSVANLLSPGQIVLSGTKTALQRVPEIAKKHGVRRALPLNVAGAFHSALMAPAARGLTAILQSIEIRPTRVPVWSNVTGRAMTVPEEIRANLERQITAPVLWQDSMEAMKAAGIRSFLEPGPGRVLTGLLKKIDPEAEYRNLDTVEA